MLLSTRRVLFLAVLSAVLASVASPASAEVRRITVSSRAPWQGGQAFGQVGPYEEIRGFVSGEIDPADPKNALITDIDLAPRNARGMVEYRTTFTLRKPVDMSRAAGVLFYNIVNRGNRNGPNTWHIGGDPGDGFLYRLGHVLLWSGWQGDMPIGTVGPEQEAIDVPIARNRDGSPVTGPVVERFVAVPGHVHTQSLAGPGRMPLTLDTTSARLISALSETPEGTKSGVREIAGSDWAFADCRTTPFPGTPDPTRVCLKDGFDPSRLYELVYTAKDPYVLGVGMAAMRDVVSFFRYAARDEAGVVNPVVGQVRHVVAMGNSQSGRFAKAFLNLGFNQDERGRIVWDGLNVRIAGMLGSFNTRFARPGDMAELYMPGADGPLWWGDYVDAARGRPAWGLLHRCAATSTCPKITETYGGPEFWYSRGTVGIAGTRGAEDLPLPDNVRRYYHAGTTHGGGPGGFNLGSRAEDARELAPNRNPQRDTDRALYVALVAWVVAGTPPPASAYPRVSDGTLVPATAAAMGWPAIPHAPSPDGVINPVLDYDFGSGYRYNDGSGVMSSVPPVIKGVIPTPVPKVNADGNEVSGLRSLLHLVPLGTYTGWNPTVGGPLAGRQRTLSGGYIPFARTRAEREASGDPRPSIEERYPGLWAYYSAAASKAAELVRDRLLLPEDAMRLLKQIVADMETSGLLRD
ncbi:MAG: hypothetical protein IT183_07055 [Acidobacteria bacterium]|nr:hypothetical protein [Acidobacteriota bacterium]